MSDRMTRRSARLARTGSGASSRRTSSFGGGTASARRPTPIKKYTTSVSQALDYESDDGADEDGYPTPRSSPTVQAREDAAVYAQDTCDSHPGHNTVGHYHSHGGTPSRSLVRNVSQSFASAAKAISRSVSKPRRMPINTSSDTDTDNDGGAGGGDDTRPDPYPEDPEEPVDLEPEDTAGHPIFPCLRLLLVLLVLVLFLCFLWWLGNPFMDKMEAYRDAAQVKGGEVNCNTCQSAFLKITSGTEKKITVVATTTNKLETLLKTLSKRVDALEAAGVPMKADVANALKQAKDALTKAKTLETRTTKLEGSHKKLSSKFDRTMSKITDLIEQAKQNITKIQKETNNNTAWNIQQDAASATYQGDHAEVHNKLAQDLAGLAKSSDLESVQADAKRALEESAEIKNKLTEQKKLLEEQRRKAPPSPDSEPAPAPAPEMDWDKLGQTIEDTVNRLIVSKAESSDVDALKTTITTHKDETHIALETARTETASLSSVVANIQENITNLFSDTSTLSQSVEELKNMERPSGVAVDMDRIREDMQQLIEKYDADRTNMTDWASFGTGGRIVGHSLSHEVQVKTGTMFSRPSYVGIKPDAMLRKSMEPGNCWPMDGSQGYAVIQLRTRVQPTHISVQHISPGISPDFSTAPRLLRFYGFHKDGIPIQMNEKKVKGFLLLDMEYNPSISPLLTMNITSDAFPAGISFEHILMKVLANHGNKDYTCIYRIRVHGRPVHGVHDPHTHRSPNVDG